MKKKEELESLQVPIVAKRSMINMPIVSPKRDNFPKKLNLMQKANQNLKNSLDSVKYKKQNLFNNQRTANEIKAVSNYEKILKQSSS